MDPALAVEALAMSRLTAMKEAQRRGDSVVSAFYKDATVFITGGTGFLGKQLVEKLFRSTDIKKVYLLLREKKGKSGEERVEENLKDPVFSSLQEQHPGFQEKLIAVKGDLSHLRIGLSEDDWRILTEEVNVIFHMAATVNFEEPILNATLTNVRGAREVLELAKACKQLKSIVHVSTAYSHATKSRESHEVLEDFYESPMHPEEMIRLAENGDEETLYNQKKLVGSDWPNTYTFTKAVGEEVVRQTAGDLPLCIVRPTIVVAAFREPSPGWVDKNNVYGPSGLLLGIAMGVIHTMMGNTKKVMSFIPVDITNNVLVVAAWETAKRRQKGIRIYTVCNSRSPGTVGDFLSTFHKEGRPLASPRTVWYIGGTQTTHTWLYVMLAWLLHYIPAFIADAGLLVVGRKPLFQKLYRKVRSLTSVLTYFTTNDWKFSDDNVQSLYKRLTPTDKDLFNFDMASVPFRELIIIWHLGVRKYIVKDGLRDTAYGVKKQKWLKILNLTVFPIYLYVLFKLLCLISSTVLFIFKMFL